MSPLKRSNNFAARMGRWSANHWKTAVFGWLAFVVAAFVIGNAVGVKYLDDTDTNVGEARNGRQDHRRRLPEGRRTSRARSSSIQSKNAHGRRRRVQGRRSPT